jgi:hypothetical protein
MIKTLLPLVLGALVLASLSAAGAADQDPLIAAPDAYQLEFENAWVKVVRVRYAPRTVVAPHFHTEQASAYVYLNDGGPILFKHEGLPYAAVTRPATKAGSFRVYKGLKEVHSVENPTEALSDFLRVEFKTEPIDEVTLRGKFFRDAPTPSATQERVQFENAQIRISRVIVASDGRLEVRASAEAPTLLVYLTQAGYEPSSPVAAESTHFEAGDTEWLDVGAVATLRGAAAAAAEVLRFDFKTHPAANTGGQ